MNVVTHEEYWKTLVKKASRTQRIGMICILVSFLISLVGSFTSAYFLVYLAYPFLIIGLPFWAMGRNNQKRMANTPRADHQLNAELKGLNNKYSLHHFARQGEQVIEHMLITPSGVIVIQTSDAIGPVSCTGSEKGDRWKSQSNLIDKFTGVKPAIGNPSASLSASIQAVQQLLSASGKPDVPVKGLIVFTRNPELELQSCSFPAIPLNETKETVKELQYDMDAARESGLDISAILTSEDRRKLNIALGPQPSSVAPKAAPARR